MVASQRCLERARPTPFDAHQFEGRPPHKTQPQASAPPTAPKRASGLLDAGPLPHLEHHRRPHPRPLELGYIPTPLLTHQDNLGSYINSFTLLRIATTRSDRRALPGKWMRVCVRVVLLAILAGASLAG